MGCWPLLYTHSFQIAYVFLIYAHHCLEKPRQKLHHTNIPVTMEPW